MIAWTREGGVREFFGNGLHKRVLADLMTVCSLDFNDAKASA
jgi:hypothetical protein